jgi:hypothetical protein
MQATTLMSSAVGTSPAALRVDYREALRHALDLGECNVDQAQELGTEAAGARFIP